MRIIEEKSNKTAFLIGALVVVILYAYYPSLFNGYVNYDDMTFIEDASSHSQSAIQKVKGIFSDTLLDVYVPLTRLFFYIEARIFPSAPFPYHFNSLLLHISVSVLVFYFAQVIGLNTNAGLFSALLFAVHPMHVESVAWVAEQKTLLYSLFYILALIYYVKYVKLGRAGYFSVSVMFGFLSILSKPMALSLPLILLLVDWYLKRKDIGNIIKEKLFHGLYIVPITLFTYLRHVRVPGNSPVEGVTLWVYSLGFYIKKFIFPHPLVPVYDLPFPIDILSGPYILNLSVVLTALVFLWIYRRQRLLIFAFLFMFFSIFFLLRFDANVDLTIFADRFMYLPSLGLCVAFGYCLDALVKRRERWHNFAAILMVCYLATLGLLTNRQTRIWNNPFSLWHHELKYEPTCGAAYAMRATDYINQGNIVSGLRDLEKALTVWPDFARAQLKYAQVLEHIGDEPKAAMYYGLSVKNDPVQKEAYDRLSLLYIKQKEFAKAVELLERALKYSPNNATAWFNLGASHFYLKNYSMSLICLNRAIEIDPLITSAYLIRGHLMAMSGKWDDALSDYKRVLEQNKEDEQVKRLIEDILNREK